MGLPPVLAGAVQVSLAEASPATVFGLPGADARLGTVTGPLMAEATPVPATFTAATVNV
jgi:hypothetical protein